MGITAAFGLALQAQEDPSWEALQAAAIRLKQTRPTAVNLAWAVDMMCAHLSKCSIGSRAVIAFDMAWKLLDDDVGVNERIGQHGLEIIRSIAARKGRCHILTHCNAGWLATGIGGQRWPQFTWRMMRVYPYMCMQMKPDLDHRAAC